MAWVFLVIGAVLVFAVAAAFVGTAAFRLGHEPRSAVFDLDEAVAHVAGVLPDSATARLSYDEVRALITIELEYLRTKGLAARPGEELRDRDGMPDVVADDDSVAVVVGYAEQEGLEVQDEDVFEVIAGLLDHLRAIGAVGGRVD